MIDNEITGLSITELSQQLMSREVSSVEVTNAYLQRIESIDGSLHSFVEIDPDGALQSAESSDQQIGSGHYKGPLHGVPMSLKDLINTKGIPTRMGSLAYRDFIPNHDATVASRLKQAGTIILGKTSMYEFAMGVTIKPPYGEFRNPWNPKHSPGGSSSGSAIAVAADLSAASIGTDTGGSVRIPSSYCGIVGLKPTWGLISDYGVMPMAYSLDTIGPMTKTAADGALLLDAIAGYDSKATCPLSFSSRDWNTTDLSTSIRGLRLGIAKELFPHPDLDDEVGQSVQTSIDLLQSLGCEIKEVSIPWAQQAPAIFAGVEEPEVVALRWDPLTHNNAELDSNTRTRLTASALIPGMFNFRARQARRVITQQVCQIFQEVDALILPSSPTPAPSLEATPHRNVREKVVGIRRTYTCLFNLTGHPALSVPCGFNSIGLPIGLQLVGRYFEDGLLFRIAHQYQLNTNWQSNKPPID